MSTLGWSVSENDTEWKLASDVTWRGEKLMLLTATVRGWHPHPGVRRACLATLLRARTTGILQSPIEAREQHKNEPCNAAAKIKQTFSSVYHFLFIVYEAISHNSKRPLCSLLRLRHCFKTKIFFTQNKRVVSSSGEFRTHCTVRCSKPNMATGTVPGNKEMPVNEKEINEQTH